MSRVSAFDVRVLCCDKCAAPLEVPVEGGEVACGACGHANAIAARPERTRLSFQTTGLTEEERLARLRAQDHKPLLPPESLKSLVERGDIPDWKAQEALQVWSNTRRELLATGGFESAERLFFLTLMFSNRLKGDEERLKKRAMYESALEAFNLPRHQQMMLCNLASQAARNGDLGSAERWLALCDPRADDLQADSYYRYTRAIVETTRGNPSAVLELLGETYDQVPVMDATDGLCTVLRANAWEARGDVEKAREQLKAHMKACGGEGQALVTTIVGNFARTGQVVCARSLPLANAEYSQEAAKAAGGVGGGVGLFMMGIGGLSFLLVASIAVAAALGTDLSFLDMEPGEYVISFVMGGIGSLVPIFIGFRLWGSAKRAERLRLHGLRGTGRIVRVERTGVTINDVPQHRIVLSVQVEGRPPYEATTRMLVRESALGHFAPGAQVNVRVDPEDPASVLIETV